MVTCSSNKKKKKVAGCPKKKRLEAANGLSGDRCRQQSATQEPPHCSSVATDNPRVKAKRAMGLENAYLGAILDQLLNLKPADVSGLACGAAGG
jgi:hypothetical protein